MSLLDRSGGKYRREEGITEKRCAACKEYWPADGEFFNDDVNAVDGLRSYCRACVQEKRRAKIENSRRV